MTSSTSFADHLASHQEFVARTLRGVLRDENEVQDVVQETWIRALRRKDASGLSGLQLGPWLARTARNIAISRWRSTARRRVRELAASTADRTVESAEVSVARIEERTRVVAAILHLTSPYRDVVLLRYEQAMSVRQIAERTGTSESTVRSQLSRAHAQLRTRLDAEFNGRGPWAMLVLPLTGRAEVASGTTKGALGVIASAGVVTALAAGAWSVSQPREGVELAPLATLESPASTPFELAAPSMGWISGQDEENANQRQSPAAPPPPAHLRLPRAELLDRTYYDDYELATFSLLRGIREDPTGKLVGNDWELQFGDGRFDVMMVTDDRSRIVDLTAFGAYEIGSALDLGMQWSDDQVAVHQGHSYVVQSVDSDTSLMTVFHVVEYVPGRRCVLDWLTTDGTGRTQGSLRNEHAGGQKLSDVLELFRGSQSAENPLQEPAAKLQFRSGAVGGNSCRINLLGEGHRMDSLSPGPLDIDSKVDTREGQVGYAEGGSVPSGSTFVVTNVRYSGWATGDSNGGAEFNVVIGGTSLFSSGSTPDRIAGAWGGEIRLSPGDETNTYLEVSNSTVGEVVLEGRFERPVEVEGQPWAKNPGFFSDVTGEVEAQLKKLRSPLTGNDLVLQVRAGAGGGNPNRIDMRGRRSLYVDKESATPLDFAEPVTMKTPSETYFEGGFVPSGKSFVVTRVHYRAGVTGDTNGTGYLRLVVGGQVIATLGESNQVIEKTWNGRLILRPDEESRTYLEVGNSCWADVTLQGFLQ